MNHNTNRNSPGDTIYGRRLLEEFLRAGRRKIIELYITDTTAKIFKKELESKGIKYKVVNKETLFKLSRRTDHQGVFGIVEPFQFYEISYFFEQSPCVIVALDSVQDPRNFGSIIRTAYLCGATGILTSERGGAPLSPVVVHTSAGATEYIPVARTKTLADGLVQLKQHNFKIFGAERSPDSIPFDTLEYPSKVVIVFGSEGGGLSGRTKKICDGLIYIPQYGLLDSFNVSVACGIITYFVCKRIKSLS